MCTIHYSTTHTSHRTYVRTLYRVNVVAVSPCGCSKQELVVVREKRRYFQKAIYSAMLLLVWDGEEILVVKEDTGSSGNMEEMGRWINQILPRLLRMVSTIWDQLHPTRMCVKKQQPILEASDSPTWIRDERTRRSWSAEIDIVQLWKIPNN